MVASNQLRCRQRNPASLNLVHWTERTAFRTSPADRESFSESKRVWSARHYWQTHAAREIEAWPGAKHRSSARPKTPPTWILGHASVANHLQ